MENILPLSSFSFEKELIDDISSLEIQTVESGTIILKENQFIKVIPLVIEGTIKLRKVDENGREIIFYHIEPGESCILSITSCLNEKESQAEAIIEKNSRLILVDAERVRKWMDIYPSWRRFVVELYYNRMSELMTLVDLITFKSVDQRLYKYIKDNSVNNQVTITHQELAGEIGTAREVVSRLLKQMEQENLILLERGKLTILETL